MIRQFLIILMAFVPLIACFWALWEAPMVLPARLTAGVLVAILWAYLYCVIAKFIGEPEWF